MRVALEVEVRMATETIERCPFPLRSYTNAIGHDGINEDMLTVL